MIKRLEEKLRDYLFGGEPDLTGPHPSQSNLLIGYFKLIHRQYRTLFLLYLGLLLGLGSLLLVVGLLLSSTVDLVGAPGWVFYSLVAVVALLLATLGKAVLGLLGLRKKNQQWVGAVMDQLITDLQTKPRTPRRSGLAPKMAIKTTQEFPLAEPLGWDVKPCPECGEDVELLDEVCPHCLFILGAPAQN